MDSLCYFESLIFAFKKVLTFIMKRQEAKNSLKNCRYLSNTISLKLLA